MECDVKNDRKYTWRGLNAGHWVRRTVCEKALWSPVPGVTTRNSAAVWEERKKVWKVRPGRWAVDGLGEASRLCQGLRFYSKGLGKLLFQHLI